ncbi:MAG: hypothetical protein EHM60_07885 [Lysobacterales bacterium]|jgi:hypothetical protein|nr:MAG: hypothetical protein EHM60_07885 [Xanthomonadales bacterium]
MVSNARLLVRGILTSIDVGYRRAHELQPVGDILHLGISRHRGTALVLPDGTRVVEGARVGQLHFDNSRAAKVQAEGRVQAGVRFARLLRDSFGELAARAQADDGLREVPLYEGVTWFQPHGRAVGFVSEPLPPGPRKQWLARYFRLMVWAFAPIAATAPVQEIEPRVFRISRNALIQNFARNARERSK